MSHERTLKDRVRRRQHREEGQQGTQTDDLGERADHGQANQQPKLPLSSTTEVTPDAQQQLSGAGGGIHGAMSGKAAIPVLDEKRQEDAERQPDDTRNKDALITPGIERLGRDERRLDDPDIAQ